MKLWKDDVVWELHADEHTRHQQEWTMLRLGADLALWPYGTWREQTRTAPLGSALDVLIPQRRPLPACTEPLAIEEFL